MCIKTKPKGHFKDDETIPRRNPEAFGYAAMPSVDLDCQQPLCSWVQESLRIDGVMINYLGFQEVFPCGSRGEPISEGLKSFSWPSVQAASQQGSP